MSEVKNSSVDKTGERVVSSESVATHLSNAIAHHSDAVQATRSNESDSHSLMSISACLIALTQHLVSTPKPDSSQPLADQNEPNATLFKLAFDESLPEETREALRSKIVSNLLADAQTEPNPNPYAQYDTKTLKEHRDFLVQSNLSNPQSVAWVEAELARRESESQSFQARNVAGNAYSDLDCYAMHPTTPFENPDDGLNHPHRFYEPRESKFVIPVTKDAKENSRKGYTFTRDELVDFIRGVLDRNQIESVVAHELVDEYLKERSA